MDKTFDVAVVGAGILGLAHAYHVARQGRKVVVFERSPQAMGASVRNFGMIWPIGQTPGGMHQMALRSRSFWLDVLADSGLWYEMTGSLHLGYEDDEAQVLCEFATTATELGYDCTLLNPTQVAERSTAAKQEKLRTALWSPTEICVDPREVIAGLPAYLSRTLGVEFVFQTAVTGYDRPTVRAGNQEWRANQLIVCSGDDLQTLFPDILQNLGIVLCKLQMMRSQPQSQDWRLGPMLAAGLTLRHYKSFQGCPSLPVLKDRVARETPLYDRYGIHVMASQNGRGEIVIGDSHEYGADIEPFNKEEIDRLILDYLQTFLAITELKLGSRWHGIYAKHPTEPFLVAQPADGVTAVVSPGGAGMTLSFGLAHHVLQTFVD